MKARGKMQVAAVKTTAYLKGEILEFKCVYDDDNPGDAAFSEYTPSGNMELTITNPALVGAYPAGSFVYVEITPTEA